MEIALGDRPALQAPERLYQRLLSRDVEESSRLLERHMADHGFETACDRLLMPAVLNGVGDHASRRISREEYGYVIETAGRLLDDIDRPPAAGAADGAASNRIEQAEAPLRIYCVSRTDLDRLGHRMLSMCARHEPVIFDIGSPGMLASEVFAHLTREPADAVCIGDSPHAGLPAAKLACRRLRRHFPGLPIVVVRWGEEGELRDAAPILRTAGATAVACSIDEARLAVVALCAGARPVPDGRSSPRENDDGAVGSGRATHVAT